MMSPFLGVLAPYVAVLAFWYGFDNAWASLLAYHALILLLSRWNLTRVPLGWNRRRFLLVAIPGVVAGPLVYFVLPAMTRVPIDTWLTAHGLSGLGRTLLVPYFGIVHPILEQAHWSSLRLHGTEGAVASLPRGAARAPRTMARLNGALAHVAFAGYHVLVLVSLLHTSWIVISVAALVLVSLAWRWLERAADGGLAIPVISHILVDSGLVLAAVLRAA